MVTAVSPIAAAPSTSYAVQNARREAQQAEQTARNLENQAQAAQRSADQEQARADDLNTRSSDANQRSATARSNLASLSDQSSRTLPVPSQPPQDPALLSASGRVGAGRASGLYVNVYA